MGVTIVQIAREAEVSLSAVSQILNRRGRFTDETRERVLAIAEKNGYRPNSSARSLRSKSSKLVGVLSRNSYEIPLTNMTAFEHLVGINQKFQDVDLVTVLVRASDIVSADVVEPRVFRERLIDGMIVVGPLADSLVKRVRALTKHIVWLDGPIWEETCCIRRDEYAAGYQSVVAMADLGYRRIHYIARESARSFHYSHALREQGAREAARAKRLRSFFITNWPESDGELSFEALGELFDDEVGVVISSMPVARQVAHKAATLGKCPGLDFGMVCCDDSNDARMDWRDLSRVSFDRYQMGARAAEMMLSLLADPAHPPPSLLINDRWLAGSTAWGPGAGRPTGP